MALINVACPHCGTVTNADIPEDKEVVKLIQKHRLSALGLSVEDENVIKAQCPEGHEMVVIVE